MKQQKGKQTRLSMKQNQLKEQKDAKKSAKAQSQANKTV